MLIGFILIAIGIVPLIKNVFPFDLPEAGSYIYQGVIILIGIIALILSNPKKQKHKMVAPEE